VKGGKGPVWKKKKVNSSIFGLGRTDRPGEEEKGKNKGGGWNNNKVDHDLHPLGKTPPGDMLKGRKGSGNSVEG